MNKEVRPFEEYKEMIQDMSKDNMIKGLYYLSANIIEKDKEIERLNNIIDEIEKTINEEINKYKGIAETQGIFIDKDLYERCDSKIGSLMYIR